MDIERALAQIAEQYRCEGYRVVPRPGDGDVPPFARGHDVDLVAYRGEEKVLVRVKVSREDLRDDPEAIRMAEAVKNQPGWRFDVVVLNPDPRAYKVPPGASEPPVEQIEQSLTHAEQIWQAGDLPLSCVVSWAALEAALRHAARAAGMGVKNSAPSYLLRALYSEGLLHKPEFDQLNEALKIRNALVHGMTVPALDPTLPQHVVAVARRLLAEKGQPLAG